MPPVSYGERTQGRSELVALKIPACGLKHVTVSSERDVCASPRMSDHQPLCPVAQFLLGRGCQPSDVSPWMTAALAYPAEPWHQFAH